jgi:hypothetical protein
VTQCSALAPKQHFTSLAKLGNLLFAKRIQRATQR